MESFIYGNGWTHERSSLRAPNERSRNVLLHLFPRSTVCLLHNVSPGTLAIIRSHLLRTAHRTTGSRYCFHTTLIKRYDESSTHFIYCFASRQPALLHKRLPTFCKLCNLRYMHTVKTRLNFESSFTFVAETTGMLEQKARITLE